MPELPEVETVRRGLAPLMEGHRIKLCEAYRLNLRWPLPKNFAARMTGQRVIRIDRRAKYLLFHLDKGMTLINHLGMSGRFLVLGTMPRRRSTGQAGQAGDHPALAKHDHVAMVLDTGTLIRFNDPRRFGMFDLVKTKDLGRYPLLAGLGPEPLSKAFNGKVLTAALHGRRVPIKQALLDQRIIAGVGNIYACEALFMAGISPRRAAATVQGDDADCLATAIKKVLRAAIGAGGSSLRDYRQASGELGYFQHRFAVYDRAGQPCPDCDCQQGIRRLVQGGRSTFYCAKRQR
ncbi:MAG: bifunctional DNA-formamidopyrimidine glycosylase/DNA-(apurinic or apyrimidinic site) lyase [Alphaproteobacteria bacterium]